MAALKNIEKKSNKMKSVKRSKHSFTGFADDIFGTALTESYQGNHFLIYRGSLARA